MRLDEKGQVAARSETKAFNPLDTDPLFTASATLDGVRYFPSLHGRMQPIDMSTDEVKVLPDWPLLTPAESAANWRPSGWQLIASDEHKLLYVLMQADAHEGTHKDAAGEVWVYDPASRARVKRMRLVRPGSSIALTHAAEPLMLVQTGERLDVYDPAAGALVRSLELPGWPPRACRSSRCAEDARESRGGADRAACGAGGGVPRAAARRLGAAQMAALDRLGARGARVRPGAAPGGGGGARGGGPRRARGRGHAVGARTAPAARSSPRPFWEPTWRSSCARSRGAAAMSIAAAASAARATDSAPSRRRNALLLSLALIVAAAPSRREGASLGLQLLAAAALLALYGALDQVMGLRPLRPAVVA